MLIISSQPCLCKRTTHNGNFCGLVGECGLYWEFPIETERVCKVFIYNRDPQPPAPDTIQPGPSACRKISPIFEVMFCFDKVLMFALHFVVFFICPFHFSHSTS